MPFTNTPTFSYGATIIVVTQIISVTILGVLHDVDGGAILTLFSAVIAGITGHELGVKAAKNGNGDN